MAAGEPVRELPSGTVTFLFTDIEGSTRLLHELGDGYADVLAEHRRILRSAVERNEGIELGSEGDALFVAFARADNAVAAARKAQLELAGGPVRVRMGLHTGEPTLREGEYVGLDLHRVARITAAGHGGQVLLSRSTRDLLDAGTGLRDLGEHRLKDLAQAEWLFQLGDEAFPPLRSLSNTNLPAQRSPLIGRERELTELATLLGREHVRLVTLTGPGGTGKTRLAVAVGSELVGEFGNGVFFVSLAAVANPAHVVPAIAEVLGVGEQREEPLRRTLTSHLEDKALLLVVDNCEQVLDAASELNDMLAHAPGLKLLVTSREPLRVRAEREYAVPPLAADDALALFSERAQAAQADFELDGDAPVARKICARLDGLPLAIELVAARVKVLTPRAILDRIEQRLPLAAGDRRDLPARQQTLRATIEWSYDLLGGTERELFARLAVFAGGWTLEAGEDVCAAQLDTFASLVDKNLIRRGADGRFAMLETIREYALERLAEDVQAEVVHSAHAQHFLALAADAELGLRSSAQLEWLGRLVTETENLRAALEWTLVEGGPSGRARVGLRIAGALARFWYAHAHVVEGCAWLERALAANPDAAADDRAKALHGLGILSDERGELERAMSLFEESIALRRAIDDQRGLASSLNSLGIVARNAGDLARSRAMFTESLELRRELGDVAGVSTTTCDLGILAVDEGDLETARALFEESLALDRQAGDSAGIAVNVANLGGVALEQGELARARELLGEGLRAFDQLGDRDGVAECLEQIGAVAARNGGHERAARLAGAAAALRENLRMPLPDADQRRLDRHLADARGVLGRRFDAAFGEGRALTYEDAVAEALEAVD